MKRAHFSKCSSCGVAPSGDPLNVADLTHNVHHLGAFRRLCSPCVLKLYRAAFCPICLEVYPDDKPLPPHAGVTCLTCPSISHSSCIHPSSPSHSLRCPQCLNPNFFNSQSQKKKTKGNRGSRYGDYNSDFAKLFLAAASISSISARKQAKFARAKAVWRAREATVATKMAKEALSCYFALGAEDNHVFVDSSVLAEKLTQDCQIGEVEGENGGIAKSY